MNSQHRWTQRFYWFGSPLWGNTLLQCGGGGLPLGLMMNNTREERPPEVEAFLGSVSLCVRSSLSSSHVSLSFVPFSLWWLVSASSATPSWFWSIDDKPS